MNIDLIPNGAIKRVHVSQNDVGRTLTFELFNNSTSYTIPSGATVKIQGTKPSGFGFSETCTVSGNVATIDTTEAMTDESGNIATELSISYNGNKIGTSNFVLAVEKNPHPDTTTDGSMETIIPELTLLVNEVKGYAEEIEGTYHVYGSPWVASTVAQMTDTNKIYVYTGSESGYTNGNWYYYNGTAWVSGGVYNAIAVSTDTTLSVSGMSADAKAVGDSLTPIKSMVMFPINYVITIADSKWGYAGANAYNYYALVSSGDVVHIKANSQRACYYALLKSFNGMTSGGNADCSSSYPTIQGVGVNTDVYVTVPSDTNYLYVFTSADGFAPSILKVNDYDLLIDCKDNITELYQKAKFLDNNSIINAYDQSSLINGYIINYSNGQPVSSQYTANYSITDYIPIEYSDVVHLAYVRGTNLCGGALYDENKTFLRTIWGTDDFSRPSTDSKKDFTFVVNDRRVKYMRYNVVEESLYKKGNQYIWIFSSPVFKKLNKEIHVGTSKEYTKLKDALDYINNNGIIGAKVYVHAGTYDLVSEFGQSYLDGITQSTNKGIGLFLGNDTHLIFEEGAKVVFNYNGNNTAICEYFSPFNITGSFVLENANIEVSNCRYCVHEDLPTSATVIPNSYTAVYKNCVMVHNGNTSGSYTGTICIGGGCMPNGLSIVEGGKYTCGTQYPRAVSYHNFYKANYGNSPSRIVLKNVWINNSFRLGTFGDSIVDVEVSGCYIPNGIYDANTSYFNVTQWNNVMN